MISTLSCCDASGQQLSVEIWASGESKTMIAIADGWRQAGVDANPVVLPPQRWNDREYVANFPGFRTQRQPNGVGKTSSKNVGSWPLLSSARPWFSFCFSSVGRSCWRST